MKYRFPLAIFALAFMYFRCGQPTYSTDVSKIHVVDKKVDLSRYLGLWYEVYRIPNGFEDKNHKSCKNVTATYLLNSDGTIKVENRCEYEDGRKECAVGVAKVVDKENNSKLKVSFFRPFYGDYWVLDLADDYSWAIVGEPEGKYLWVLSRDKVMSSEIENKILEKVESFGFKKQDLLKTVHN